MKKIIKQCEVAYFICFEYDAYSPLVVAAILLVIFIGKQFSFWND